jgi:hypothetical protein
MNKLYNSILGQALSLRVIEFMVLASLEQTCLLSFPVRVGLQCLQCLHRAS